MKMKKILSASLVAIALIGTLSAASAAPYGDSINQDRLAFWQAFADRNSD
jgi:hypothetical protein